MLCLDIEKITTFTGTANLSQILHLYSMANSLSCQLTQDDTLAVCTAYCTAHINYYRQMDIQTNWVRRPLLVLLVQAKKDNNIGDIYRVAVFFGSQCFEA